MGNYFGIMSALVHYNIVVNINFVCFDKHFEQKTELQSKMHRRLPIAVISKHMKQNENLGNFSVGKRDDAECVFVTRKKN